MSDAIKILYIIDCFKNPYAGTEGQLMKLVTGLDNEKFCPHLVILRDDFFIKGNDVPLSSDIPLDADVLDIRSLSSPGSWITLYRYLKKKKSEGFTIAHTFFYDAALICPPILKILGYKILVSRRDMGYWYTGANLAILKVNACFVDRVIANSEAVKSITMRKEWYKSNRIEVIYNGYQAFGKVSTIEKPEDLITGNKFSIVLVANLRPIKRIEDAINAVKLINDTDRVVLYVIGDGDGESLKQLCVDLNMGPSVNFLGLRTDITAILSQFDVGILCSESEGFSNALIEYMQAGLPVVCSNVGGNPEIIENGVNGFLYEMGDAHALATHIKKLVRDKPLRLQLGGSGKKKVQANYVLSKYVEKHQHLYKELSSSKST